MVVSLHGWGQRDKRQEIDALNNKASSLVKNDPVSALKLSEKALLLADEENYTRGHFIALRNKANILLIFGQVREAESLVQISLSMAESLKNDTLLAQAYHLYGYIKMDPTSVGESMNYLSKSLVINKRLGLVDDQIKNLTNIAILNYWMLGKKEEGKKIFRQTFNLARNSSNKFFMAELASNISSLESKEMHLKESKRWLSLSDSLNYLIGNQAGLIFNRDQEARIALSSGNLEEAMALAESAVKMGESCDLKSACACALSTAAEVAEAKGDFSKAYYLYKRYHRMEDSINTAEKTRLVALSNLVLQSEQQKKENENLKRDKRLQQQKLFWQNLLIIIIGLFLVSLGCFLVFLLRKNKKVNQLVELLQKQNHAIGAQKLQIEELNSNLETLVKDRTVELEARTNQILEFASYNSHVVRGPLARIMGLAFLLKNTRSPDEKTMFTTKMEESAYEMDQAIKVLNTKLTLEKGNLVNQGNVIH